MTTVAGARILRALSEMQFPGPEALASNYPTLAAALADFQYEEGHTPPRALRTAHRAAGYGQ